MSVLLAPRGVLASVLAAALLAGAFAAVGCGKNEDKPAASAATNRGRVRLTDIRHTACDESKPSEQHDNNGDGKIDVALFLGPSGTVACSRADVDFDGKPDMYSYFDASGMLLRRESDYDSNGVANAVETYQSGKLVLREIDSAGQGRFDTWDTFDPASEKRTLRERDLNGDGNIDQVWAYAGDKITITFDRNHDGEPDPESGLLWGPSGIVPLGPTGTAIASASAPSTSATAPPTAAAPLVAPLPPTAAAPEVSASAVPTASGTAPKVAPKVAPAVGPRGVTAKAAPSATVKAGGQ